MDIVQVEMMKAYASLYRAMLLSGWKDLYYRVRLRPDDAYEINFYASHSPENDYALCAIIRGILFDQVPELYQVLK